MSLAIESNNSTGNGVVAIVVVAVVVVVVVVVVVAAVVVVVVVAVGVAFYMVICFCALSECLRLCVLFLYPVVVSGLSDEYDVMLVLFGVHCVGNSEM